MSKTPKKSVQETGARAGEILIGVFPRNNGLLIRVARSQTKNEVRGGPIKGEFRVLDSGTGTYAKGISAICEINPEFDSVDEFMTLVSAQPKCGEIKHVLNTNGLWKLDTKLIKDKIFS